MSRNYDNWEKLVGAVLRREKDRQLAYCESFSSLGSADVSLRPSSASDVLAADPSARGIFASHSIMAIPFEELRLATQKFQPDMLLGEGKFGPVFKGWIHEHFLTAVKPGFGIAVAVKKLKEREVYYFNEPRHPNLVKLIGYGFEEGSSALVYEFMLNGSLDNHLFTRGPQLLSWETRIKVAVGAARGLSFLHDLKIIVTHQGVKSSSILLDDEFNPNLSDFALTRFASRSSKIVMNDYTAPEFTTNGRLTMKSDVYSFGIILLELLSGLRVLDHNRPVKDQNLVVWSKPYLRNKRKLLQIVDSRLEGQYPHDEAYTVGKLASQCLSLDPKLRPMMSEVVDALEQLQCLNTEAKLSHALSVGPRYPQNAREPLFPTDIDIKMDGAGSSKWSVIGPDNRMVVCEFKPRGSLDKHLFESMQVTLPWVTRMKVAVGAARALAALHGLDIPVIHRNITSGNILLDADFNPKLSDFVFGHAIDGSTGEMTYGETRIMGTYGYAAPEYVATGRLTTRSDVYGLGVILLELLSGLRVMDMTRPEGKHHLMDWAIPYLRSKRKLSRIIDSRLEGEYPPKEAYKVAQISLQCICSEPRLRPTMVEVVAALDKL